MLIDRRKFLAGMVALAAGCGSGRGPEPPLDDLYDWANSGEQPPLLVIPGAFGSRLLDTRSGEEIWPRSSAKLLLSSFKGLEVEIDEATLDPVVRCGCLLSCSIIVRHSSANWEIVTVDG